MRHKTAPILLLVCLNLILGCLFGNPSQNAQRIGPVLEEGQKGTQNDNKESFPPYFPTYEPMTADILEDVQSYSWGFRYSTHDNSQPPCRMWSNVGLGVPFPEGGQMEMAGIGYLSECSWLNYAYDFPSTQPFLDLMSYMHDHPDVLFDHSEFEGEPYNWWGSFNLSAGADEYFVFSAGGPNIGQPGNALCIAKQVLPGLPVDPDVQYVIDTLRDWRDELLQHPVE